MAKRPMRQFANQWQAEQFKWACFGAAPEVTRPSPWPSIAASAPTDYMASCPHSGSSSFEVPIAPYVDDAEGGTVMLRRANQWCWMPYVIDTTTGRTAGRAYYTEQAWGGKWIAALNRKVIVVVGLGQSNWVGRDTPSTANMVTNCEGLSLPLEISQFYHLDGTAATTNTDADGNDLGEQYPVDFVGSFWGPYVGIARQVVDDGFTDVVFCNVGQGSTSMHTDWASGGSMRNALDATHAALVAHFGANGFVYAAGVLYQGESDASDATHTANWPTNAGNLLDHVEAYPQWDADAEWAVIRIHEATDPLNGYPVAGQRTYGAEMRTNQATFCTNRANATMHSVDAYNVVAGDEIHVDYIGRYFVGKNIYTSQLKAVLATVRAKLGRLV